MEKLSLFFGTANRHKLEEIRQILGDRFQIKSFEDVPPLPEIEETENTLEGNAALKAKAFFQFTGIPCFADDTGLEVEALGGSPGVYSARFAGPEQDAEKNMNKLLGEMNEVQNREARFRTVICFYDGRLLKNFEGVLNGTIGREKKGTNGFGYDPVFIPEGSSKTLGQYSAAEKSSVSHRAQALNKLTEFLLNIYAR